MRILLLFALLFAGCGDTGPKTWPVSGDVVFRNGKPVTFGIIEFAPLGDGPGARGSIDVNGHFTLKTGELPGAIADKHRVVIVQFALKDGLPKEAREHNHMVQMVHAKYARFESSRLECVVEAGKNNVFNLEVDPGN